MQVNHGARQAQLIPPSSVSIVIKVCCQLKAHSLVPPAQEGVQAVQVVAVPRQAM